MQYIKNQRLNNFCSSVVVAKIFKIIVSESDVGFKQMAFFLCYHKFTNQIIMQ